MVAEVELAVAETNVGEVVNPSESPSPSVSVSLIVNPDRLTLPIFFIVMVYTILSPKSFEPLPLLSLTKAVFVTSIIGKGCVEVVVVVISTTVASSVVFPSVSLPLSLVSETLPVLPGPVALTIALFTTLPVSAAAWVIV